MFVQLFLDVFGNEQVAGLFPGKLVVAKVTVFGGSLINGATETELSEENGISLRANIRAR